MSSMQNETRGSVNISWSQPLSKTRRRTRQKFILYHINEKEDPYFIFPVTFQTFSISKYRRAPKRTPTIDSHETDQVPSSGSSPRSEASFDSTYLRAGNFDEIKAEFSRSKRRRLDAYRLIQKLKQDEHLMLKGDLKELAGGLYDADISMLDTRINQLEKENNKLKYDFGNRSWY